MRACVYVGSLGLLKGVGAEEATAAEAGEDAAIGVQAKGSKLDGPAADSFVACAVRLNKNFEANALRRPNSPEPTSAAGGEDWESAGSNPVKVLLEPPPRMTPSRRRATSTAISRRHSAGTNTSNNTTNSVFESLVFGSSIEILPFNIKYQ